MNAVTSSVCCSPNLTGSAVRQLSRIVLVVSLKANVCCISDQFLSFTLYCVTAEICHLQSLGLVMILRMMIPLLLPMSVLFKIQSIARQNRNGDIMQPCFNTSLDVKLFF